VGTGALPRPAGSTEPSWGRVLLTTIKLSASRRPGRFAIVVVALAAAAVIVLCLAGGRSGTPSRAAPAAGAGPPSPAAVTKARAAAWIAGQVSGNAIVACSPSMCAALQQQGVAAGRLMPLRSAAASPRGASVLVTTPPDRGQPAGQYAPALIASFGSGGNRVEVRAVEPGGAPAYRAALRADLGARRAAGSQLLGNSHIRFSGPDAAQLRAGQVDARLLATLAALSSGYSFRVTAFGDSSPGAPVLFREVTITGIGRGLAAALAMARAQDPPYLPAHAAAADPAGLSIEFSAPSPLGLLSPDLDADQMRGT